ncbi:hypothetical protein TRVL_04664 [Trypanosoma vivax]|nr:hypothetical protein TRVL_04664 [Trypanosoma vivax]
MEAHFGKNLTLEDGPGQRSERTGKCGTSNSLSRFTRILLPSRSSSTSVCILSMSGDLTARESSRRSFRPVSPCGCLRTCLSCFEVSTRPIESVRRFGRRGRLCLVDRLSLQPSTFSSHSVAVPRTGVMSLMCGTTASRASQDCATRRVPQGNNW